MTTTHVLPRLAAALGDRGHARQGSEGRIVPARKRPGCLGEQGGERDRTDPGQRTKDGRIARSAVLGRRLGLAQSRAELLELACGLTELMVGQAEPGDEGANVENSSLRDTRGHRDRRL